MTQLAVRGRRGATADVRLVAIVLSIAIGTSAGFILGHLTAGPGEARTASTVATTSLEDLPGWLEYRSGERADLAGSALGTSAASGPFEVSRGTATAWAAWLDYRAGEREPLAPVGTSAP